MKKRTLSSDWASLSWQVLILGLLVVLAGCSEQAETSVADVHKTWQLPVSKVVIADLPINYSTTGTVVSDQRIAVTSRTTGYIRETLVQEGEQVTKGQDLVLLDDADVEGTIHQALAAVSKSKTTLTDAETDLKRYEDLYKRGSVSESVLRKTRLKHDVARDTLGEAQAALNTAEAQRKYIRIISPVTGVVVARHKQDGDLATPGVPILTVESNQELLFETYVAESRIGKIKQDDAVQVNIDALDVTLAGVVARVVPAGDPVTRRYLVKVTLPEQDGLLSGMFGRARFQLGTEPSPVIPPSAILERGGLRGVFVVDDEDRVHFRWLHTGKVWRDRIEVRVGLQGGERIVAMTENRLRDGDLVSPEGVSGE